MGFAEFFPYVNSIFNGVHCSAYSCNREIKNIKSISIVNTLQQCTPIRAVSFRVQILMLKHTTPTSNYGRNNTRQNSFER